MKPGIVERHETSYGWIELRWFSPAVYESAPWITEYVGHRLESIPYPDMIVAATRYAMSQLDNREREVLKEHMHPGKPECALIIEALIQKGRVRSEKIYEFEKKEKKEKKARAAIAEARELRQKIKSRNFGSPGLYGTDLEQVSPIKPMFKSGYPNRFGISHRDLEHMESLCEDIMSGIDLWTALKSNGVKSWTYLNRFLKKAVAPGAWGGETCPIPVMYRPELRTYFNKQWPFDLKSSAAENLRLNPDLAQVPPSVKPCPATRNEPVILHAKEETLETSTDGQQWINLTKPFKEQHSRCSTDKTFQISFLGTNVAGDDIDEFVKTVEEADKIPFGLEETLEAALYKNTWFKNYSVLYKGLDISFVEDNGWVEFRSKIGGHIVNRFRYMPGKSYLTNLNYLESQLERVCTEA